MISELWRRRTTVQLDADSTRSARSRRNITGRDVALLVSLATILMLVHIVITPLNWTGDEPRYTYQGLGIFSNFSPAPSAARWEAFTTQNGLAPAPPGPALPFATFAPSLVAGAGLAAGSLEFGRWLMFVLGIVGLAALFFFLLSTFRDLADPFESSSAPVYATIVITALSLPFLAYLKLLYPEIPLFVTICGALYSLRDNARSNLLITIGWGILLPFVYIRALPLSIGFAVIAILLEFRNGKAAGALRLIGIYAVGLAGFEFYYSTFFNGSRASYVYIPSISLIPERLGMQLFDVRHGLIAYSPIFLIGFAGLLLGIVRRVPLCLQSAFLLAIYTMTFIWATASESITGRYWVAALPFLAVGMTYWLRCAAKNWLALSSAGLLAILTFTNTILFIKSSAYFIENRRETLSYAYLFTRMPFHFGLYLPVDLDRIDTRTLPALLALTVLVVAALVVAAMQWNGRVRRMSGIAAIAICLVPFLACAAYAIPQQYYTVSTNAARSTLTVDIDPHVSSVFALQIDDPAFSDWNDAPRTVHIRCQRSSGALAEWTQPDRPLMTFLRCARHIEISTLGQGGNSALFRPQETITLIERAYKYL